MLRNSEPRRGINVASVGRAIGPRTRWLAAAWLALAFYGSGFASDELPDDGSRGDAQVGERSSSDASPSPSNESEPGFRTEVIHGRVRWLAEILDKSFGISTVPEASQQSLAILSKDGQVYPLVENIRGRAFRKDQRLRDRELEIWVRRYDRQPLVQVLRIIEQRDDGRFELDYWCDVCAIPMYEAGPCDCCQDHNRLRDRPADP